MDGSQVFCCTRCEYECRSFWRLIKHYHAIHSTEAGFRILCGVENCCKAYCNIKALCAHMREKHIDFYTGQMMAPKLAGTVDLLSSLSLPDNLVGNNEAMSQDNIYDIIGMEVNECALDATAIAANHVASLSLKLREVNKISGTACEDIRHNLGFMLNDSREQLLHTVQNKLLEFGASSTLSSAILEVMSLPSPYESACEALANEYHVNKHVEANFAYVEPVQYLVNGVHKDSFDQMQYIPLIESLKVLLQNDDIFSSVIDSHQADDGKLRDLCDGTYLKQHPLFSTDKNALHHRD